MAEEESAPTAEESAPAPQAESEVEGSTIPEVVPIEGLAPETQGATGGAPEPAEVASGGAPAMAGGERDDVLPESTLEVVVRSPEIQDAEPIRSTPMSGAATSSRGGIELLADDLATRRR
jgi:hypothetical protein